MSSSTAKQGDRRILARGVLAVIAITAVAFASWRVLPVIATAQAANSIEQRRLYDAMAWLEFAERLGHQSAQSALLAARTHRKLGDLEAFQASITLAEALGGDFNRIEREWIFLKAQGGRVDEVELELPKLLQDPQGDGREICEAFANGYIANYRIEEAAPLLDVWQTDFSDDPQVYVLQGRVIEHKGKWEEAAEKYKTALEIRPGYGPAAYNLARVQLNRKKPEEALESYKVSARWLHNDVPARVGMAHCLRILNRPEEARDLLQPFLELNGPELFEAFREVGQTTDTARSAVAGELGRIELAAGNFERAAEVLEGAVKQSPLDHTLHYLLGRALAGSGETEAAKPHLEFYKTGEEQMQRLDGLMETLRAEPHNVSIRTEIGTIFLRYLSSRQGVIWLNSVFAFDPGYKPAHAALAEYYESRAN